MNIKLVLRLAVKGLLILLCCAFAGFILLALTYLIPTDRIRNNISNSIEQYKDVTVDPEWSTGYLYTLLDEYTDTTFMLTNAVYSDDKGIFRNAALVPHIDYIGVNNDILYELDYADDSLESYYFVYGRYWHGYLLLLKPLLFFISLNSVRLINFFFQAVMVLMTLYLVGAKYKDGWQAFGLSVGLIILNPVSAAMNFQLSAVYNITIVAIMAVLLFGDKIDIDETAPLLFLGIGIAVAYFDFLTYPIVSLMMPLLVYLSIKKDEIKSVLIGISHAVIFFGFWGFGYLGMWGLKWIIADLVTGGEAGIIADAIGCVLGRTKGVFGEDFSVLYIITSNLAPLLNWPFITLALVFIVAVIITFIRNGKKIRITPIAITYMVVGLFTFVWLVVVKQHSYNHPHFVFRVYAGLAMALVMAVGECLDAGKREKA